MELTRNFWGESEKLSFVAYLERLKSTKDQTRSRRILNTNLPLLGMDSQTLTKISKAIFKGHYQSFLSLQIDGYYEVIAIYGKILTWIKDFDEMMVYLPWYLENMENWAHCDILTFKITDKNLDRYMELSKHYKDHKLPFVRRFSLYILLNISRNKNINEHVFKRLESLKNETDYYVIMMAAWLLCEVIIKHKVSSFLWLDKTTVHSKIMHKAISKCRDSFRLTDEDKDYLLKYR